MMKLWSRSILLLSLMREVELMSLLIEILLFVCYGDLKSWKIYGKCVLDAVFSPDSSEYYILENWYLVLPIFFNKNELFMSSYSKFYNLGL